VSSSATAGIVLFCGLVSGSLSARLLGPEGRGELSLLTYFPAIIGSIFSLALPQALTFLVSRDTVLSRSMQAAGIHLAILLGVLGGVCVAPAAYFMMASQPPPLRLAAVCLCLSGPLMVLNPTMYAINRALHEFNWVNCGQIIVAGVYPLALLVLMTSAGVTPVTAGISFVGVQLLLVVLHLRRIGADIWVMRAKPECYAACVRYAFRFFLPTAASLIYINADKALLMRLTSLEQIGFYSVAAAIAYPISMAAEVISQVTFVEISQTPKPGTGRLLSQRFQFAQLIVLCLICVFMPFLRSVLHLVFGPAFDVAFWACFLLVISMAFRGLAKLLDNGLRATDVVWPGTLASIVSGCVLAFLGWRWIPRSGAEGFAEAVLIADIVGLVILLLIGTRSISGHLSDFWGLRPNVARSLYRIVSNRVLKREYFLDANIPN
jgi:O-antigen/teichoic acid export membrane protein